jgi:hypothetical protein
MQPVIKDMLQQLLLELKPEMICRSGLHIQISSLVS